jgi:hypothetical protein
LWFRGRAAASNQRTASAFDSTQLALGEIGIVAAFGRAMIRQPAAFARESPKFLNDFDAGRFSPR